MYTNWVLEYIIAICPISLFATSSLPADNVVKKTEVQQGTREHDQAEVA